MVSRPAAKQTKFGSSLCDLWLWSLNSLSLYFLMYTYRSAVAEGSIGRNIGSCSRGLITPWLFEIPKNCHLWSYAGTRPLSLHNQVSKQQTGSLTFLVGSKLGCSGASSPIRRDFIYFLTRSLLMWNAMKGSCKDEEKSMRNLPALQAPKGLTPKATSLWLLYCLPAPDHPACGFPKNGMPPLDAIQKTCPDWPSCPQTLGAGEKQPAGIGGVMRLLVLEYFQQVLFFLSFSII